MMTPLLILGMFAAALLAFWCIIEFRPGGKSRGIISSLIGCALFALGLVGITSGFDKIFCWLVLTIGLLTALFGASRFVISGINSND